MRRRMGLVRSLGGRGDHGGARLHSVHLCQLQQVQPGFVRQACAREPQPVQHTPDSRLHLRNLFCYVNWPGTKGSAAESLQAQPNISKRTRIEKVSHNHVDAQPPHMLAAFQQARIALHHRNLLRSAIDGNHLQRRTAGSGEMVRGDQSLPRSSDPASRCSTNTFLRLPPESSKQKILDMSACCIHHPLLRSTRN